MEESHGAAAPRARTRPPRIAAALCALVAAAPCGAAPSRLAAGLGFGGIVVPGRWNPLWARSEGGSGEATIQVVLRAEDGSEIGIESFPCRDGLRLECPVMVDERLQTVSVRLLSSGEILAEEKLAARSRLFPGHVVLVCGEGARTELAVSAALHPSEPVQAVSLGLADLPSQDLDYDAVSALVLRDPGSALGPAQRDSIRSWVAGGGRLAVTAPRLDGAGAASFLFPERRRDRANGRSGDGAGTSSFAFGLGTVVFVDEAPVDDGSGEAEKRWKSLLALRPYGSSERLSASRAFKARAASFPKGREAARAELLLLAALALWAAVALLASRNRKKSPLPVFAAALASLAFALAGASPLDAMLRRGALVSARALVLPGDGSAIASFSVKTPFGDPSRSFLGVRALRGLEVAYGPLEKGLMGEAEGGAFEWSHELPRSSMSLRAAGRDELELVGVLGPEVLELSGFPRAILDAEVPGELPGLEPPGELALVRTGGEGASWSSRKDGLWRAEGSAPPWLGPDLAWVESLCALAPGDGFLVGRCEAPALRLSVCGSPATRLLWAMRLPSGRALSLIEEASP